MAIRYESSRHDPRDRTPLDGSLPLGAQVDPEPTFGDLLNGVSFDGPRRRRRRPGEIGPAATTRGDGAEAARHASALYAGNHDDDDDDDRAPAVVRPYAWTRGRTTSRFRLEIETLLSTTDLYDENDDATPSEYCAVADLCRQPRSVAEVAALLRLPLGVAKVLAGDMAENGLLVVHETVSANGDTPDQVLMERILSGLRKL
jgi:Protein of unknown function (DUF742)